MANVFYNAGFRPGECVALFMENRPEYVGLWLGCTKLGLVPALINSNLVGDSLLHSIEVFFNRLHFHQKKKFIQKLLLFQAASSRALIYGAELTPVIEEVSNKMNKDLPLFVSGSVKDGIRIRTEDTNLDVEVANSSQQPLPESLQKRMHFTDKLLYIYTSGTTGNRFVRGSILQYVHIFF